jgi:hypothetical protein
MFKVLHGADNIVDAPDMAAVVMEVIRLMAHNATNILIMRKEAPVEFTMDWDDKRGGRISTMSFHVGIVEHKEGCDG